MQRSPADWQRRLQLLKHVGAHTVVVQYSGDDQGSYDARTPEFTPVASLLTAADALGMSVYLGLFSSSAWPHQQHVRQAIAPPLSNGAEVAWLGELCSAHPSCVGWYIPQEIDERTWSSPEASAYLRKFLSHSSHALRAIRDLPVAIAPFYAETLEAKAFAAFWDQVLPDDGIDVLMLQDGAGARGTALPRVQALLRELRPVLARKGVKLWSVVELFDQTAGPPRNSQPFKASPTKFERMRERLRSERPWVEATVGFSILDYMPPEGELYTRYAAFCGRY